MRDSVNQIVLKVQETKVVFTLKYGAYCQSPPNIKQYKQNLLYQYIHQAKYGEL